MTHGDRLATAFLIEQDALSYPAGSAEYRAMILAGDWLRAPDEAPGDDSAIPGYPTPQRIATFYNDLRMRGTIVTTALAYVTSITHNV